MYFYNLSFHPFGATWGGRFKPTDVCHPLVFCPPEGGLPTPEPSVVIPCIPQPTPTPTETGGPPPDETLNPPPTKKPKPTIGLPRVEQAVISAVPVGITPMAAFPMLAPLVGIGLGRLLRPKRRR